MRALITGITGQDGSYLAEFLLSKGYEVHGLVRRSSVPRLDNIAHLQGRVVLHEGDLGDAVSLARALEAAGPEEVYNLAAQSNVGTSFGQPLLTFDTDALGALRLLEAVRRHAPAARTYQASSSEMYGNALHDLPPGSRLAEGSPMLPESPYGVAKLAAHHAARLARQEGQWVACGILFNHESPRRGEGFVTRRITKGLARVKAGVQERVELGNLDAVRDWGYAPDYVRAMWLMLQAEEPRDYVIATGEGRTVREFAREAWRAAGGSGEPPVVSVEGLRRPCDIDLLVGDASRARRDLGWEPTVGFGDMVGRMVRRDEDSAEVLVP